METKTFEAPALYGDHHVSEVQRILKELPGVEEVYASSAFQAIEVTFDESKTAADKIAACLEEAGYLGEIPMLAETGVAAYGKENGNSNFRNTTVYNTVKQTVSFAQQVQHQGRALWPCPGLGAVKMDEQ
ncbi:MAG: heavy-metal-associated domain-containing protein [Anaerolineales bacterium]|nr:heavy-metal-associated domain-containing protein [Anaerolineales bacterium]